MSEIGELQFSPGVWAPILSSAPKNDSGLEMVPSTSIWVDKTYNGND